MTDVSHRRGASAADQGAVPGPRQGRRSGSDTPRTKHGSGGRRAAGGGQRAAGRGRAGRKKKRSVGKVVAITSSALVIIVAGVGTLLYEHLNGNIKSVAISGAGSEKADAFGRYPINVLVIGSDGRNNSADCHLGGDCGNGQGQNADVEMLVHISADRSNATAMSIPRDTVTHIPACQDEKGNTLENGYTGTINSALQYGPQCQVKAVHALTGIPIDHFTMIDFSGVVNMSDAVGGVQVCVNKNVYDPQSHLKLSQGTHTLQGIAALEWLRTRHGFGVGSDIGRTVTQHMYLSALMRKFKSAGTLTDPTALYSLADAATKALTVDTGLNSITKLIGLADDINKVPTDRITFTTMQTVPDPSDPQAHVVLGPGANSLFNSIVNDQSLSGSSAKPAAGQPNPSASAAPSQPPVPDSQIAVHVQNASGVTGRASEIARDLVNRGFSPNTTAANAPAPASATTLHYAPGLKGEAQSVAQVLGIPGKQVKEDADVSSLTLVIGSDWNTGSTYPAATPVPADTHKALSNSNAQTADQSRCAEVSTFNTVTYDGVPMTPTRAYALAANVPNSAP